MSTALPAGLPEVAKGPAEEPLAVQDATVAQELVTHLETGPERAVRFLLERGLCLMPAPLAAQVLQSGPVRMETFVSKGVAVDVLGRCSSVIWEGCNSARSRRQGRWILQLAEAQSVSLRTKTGQCIGRPQVHRDRNLLIKLAVSG